jgi:hypothetical protein
MLWQEGTKSFDVMLFGASQRFFRPSGRQFFQYLEGPRLQRVLLDRLINPGVGAGQTVPVAFAVIAGVANITASVWADEPIDRWRWPSPVVAHLIAVQAPGIRTWREKFTAGSTPPFINGEWHRSPPCRCERGAGDVSQCAKKPFVGVSGATGRHPV